MPNLYGDIHLERSIARITRAHETFEVVKERLERSEIAIFAIAQAPRPAFAHGLDT